MLRGTLTALTCPPKAGNIILKLNARTLPELSLFPLTAAVNNQGHLSLGGCDTTDLVEEFGTPLYVFDEFTIRHKCRQFTTEFSRHYRNTLVIYASKAFLNPALVVIINQEGLGLDVVSGGELSIARSVDFPLSKVYFHGNNKTPQELELALSWNVGRVVVDNFYELELLNRLAGEKGTRQDILLRITPGVDPHTHKHTTTGTLDSKFGFPLATGQAEKALAQAASASHLNLVGLHFHLGSPISELEPYQLAIELVLHFAQRLTKKHNLKLGEFSIGGGFAVQYSLDSSPPDVADYARAIGERLNDLIPRLRLDYPRLIIEPGRGIIAQAGVALYKTGAIKEIPGIRKYVCIDGGMSDNIRPALYGARYEAVAANKASETEREMVTISGKLCESGDILIRDARLAPVSPGDIIAVPVCGAYSIPMWSNYNALPRPAIIMVNEGQPRLVRRRESYEDLISLDRL